MKVIGAISAVPEPVLLLGGLKDLVAIYNESAHLGWRRKLA